MWGLLVRLGMWLLGGLIEIVPTLVGNVLVSLGIGVVAYTGVSSTLSWLESLAVGQFQLLPASVLGLLGLMQVGVCISMVSSALVVRLTINGLTSDTVKSWVKK